jgi:hypothetical protein
VTSGIRITTNTKSVSRQIRAIEDKLPEIIYWSTVNTAEKAKDAVVDEMRRVIDRPTPFILRSLRLTNSRGGRIGRKALKGGDAEVYLWFKDDYGSFVQGRDSATRIMLPQVYGGARTPKSSEARLRRAGIIGRDEYLVPSRTAPLNKYGNIPRPTMQKILSDLQTYSYSDASGNTKRRKRQYVIGEIKGTKGIFKVNGGISNTKGNWKLIFIVVKGAPTYSKRLDFEGVARNKVNQVFRDEFRKRLAKEVAKIGIR